MGFKEGHHPWQKYGVTYSPTKLITHLTEVVIPLQPTKTITDKPPMEVPTITNLPSFGTMAPYVVDINKSSYNKVATDKQNKIKDREKYNRKEMVIN